jgi:hypothetical protein
MVEVRVRSLRWQIAPQQGSRVQTPETVFFWRELKREMVTNGVTNTGLSAMVAGVLSSPDAGMMDVYCPSRCRLVGLQVMS